MRLGLPEMLVVLLIVLVIFGASRLPELGKGIGRSIRNFKDAVREDDKDATASDASRGHGQSS